MVAKRKVKADVPASISNKERYMIKLNQVVVQIDQLQANLNFLIGQKKLLEDLMKEE